MIDTVVLRLYAGDAIGNDLSQTKKYISVEREVADTTTGEIIGSGYFRNMRISYSNGSVVIKGSIAGLMYPNNSYIPKRDDVRMALEQISDSLHLPFGNANVTRLDCAYHWNMSKEVRNYLPHLKDLTWYQRYNATDTTLYFKKGGKKETSRLAFYDKSKECFDLGVQMQEGFGENVLRYEKRWLSRVPYQFRMSELKASTLINEIFYGKMVKMWSIDYANIHKSHDGISFKVDGLRGVRGANDYIFSILLNKDYDNIAINIQKQIKDEKVFSNPKRNNDLRKSINHRRESVSFDINNDLISELDAKVVNVASNWE